MKATYMRVAFGAVALGLVGGIAVAQNIDEITVQGTRTVNTKEVRLPYEVPVNDVSLTYGVSTKGLDLTSDAGFMEAEKRVKDVAATACRELGKLYPHAAPSNEECTKVAVDEAMVKLKKLAAAAGKASGK